MAAGGLAEAFGSSFGSALAAALGVAFFILLLAGAAVFVAVVAVFFIGLQKRPRTTLLSYALALVFAGIGGRVGLDWLVFVGAGIGIGVGRYVFEDAPIAVFQSRAYRIFLAAVNGLAVFAGLALSAKLLSLLGPYLTEAVVAVLVLTGITMLPSMVGAFYFLKLR